MARPEKKTVDYFPHIIKNGKTITILENKFGNDGYAFWFKLLEILGSTAEHVYKYKTPAEKEFLHARTLVNEKKAIEILDLLADLGAIDKELWRENIIWSDNFVKNIEDVYERRKVNVPQKPSPNGVNDNENSQSKVKDSKLKNSKVKDSKEKSSDQESEDSSPKFDEDSAPYQLALKLRDRITGWHDPVPSQVPDSNPKNMDKWSKDMDRLMRLGPVGGDEGPSKEQVEYIIHWIYDIDDFWRDTIMSPSGIRSNLSKITAQIRKYRRKKEGRDKFNGKSESEYLEDLIEIMEGENEN